MSKSSPRTRAYGAYVIRSAESRPLDVKPNGDRTGTPPVVTRIDRSIAKAVRQHRRAA